MLPEPLHCQAQQCGILKDAAAQAIVFTPVLGSDAKLNVSIRSATAL
jgi:hypothetical protein